jgi:hypothetical protein
VSLLLERVRQLRTDAAISTCHKYPHLSGPKPRESSIPVFWIPTRLGLRVGRLRTYCAQDDSPSLPAGAKQITGRRQDATQLAPAMKGP